MAKRNTRGIEKHHEVKLSYMVRDVRPIRIVAWEFIRSQFGGSVLIALIVLMSFLFPKLSDLFFLIIVLVFVLNIFQTISLPAKMPITAPELDPNNPRPDNGKAGKSEGIYYFGNDLASKHELWFSDSDMRTHALIFGSTGSGKTEALLSIAYNSLVRGSGMIYVDGKGDNALYSKVYSMAKSLGREDDVLVINFMTGGKDIIGNQKTTVMTSNTLNPFSSGSSSMLSQLITSLMPNSGGGSDGDMWKGRAIAFTEALMRALVYLRDEGYLKLDAASIRRYFTLDALEGLVDSEYINYSGSVQKTVKDIPIAVLDPLINYLATLPGYQKSKKGKQSDRTYEQHGYITMQLTRIFGSLADVYSYITGTDLAEVDLHDVVMNRRILVVLLPALEKSPDELANLGKVIIASLRAMLAAGLGNKLQGTHGEVIEAKPASSKEPFLCILDEYGYYAVPGFAVVPAQARSLGFSVVFAGQDIPAFQKASKEEAASIFANTNIKMCMKLEDPTETWDFFSKTAGEAYVSSAKSYNMGDNGSYASYKDSKEVVIDKRARIDLMDLKDQAPGEAHLFFRSSIIRTKMFYANPKPVPVLRVNAFIRVPLIDKPLAQRIRHFDHFDQAGKSNLSLREPSKLLQKLVEKPANGTAAETSRLYRTILSDQTLDLEEDFDELRQAVNQLIDENENSLSAMMRQDLCLPTMIDLTEFAEVTFRLGLRMGQTRQMARQSALEQIEKILNRARLPDRHIEYVDVDKLAKMMDNISAILEANKTINGDEDHASNKN